MIKSKLKMVIKKSKRFTHFEYSNGYNKNFAMIFHSIRIKEVLSFIKSVCLIKHLKRKLNKKNFN